MFLTFFLRSGLENGKFLVRSNSSTNNPQTDSYKISLCYNNEIKHYKIKTNVVKSEDGGGGGGGSVNGTVRYSFEGGLEFESITQLVDYYHRCADGLAYTLRTPFIPHTRIDPVLLSFLTAATSNPTNGAATSKTNVIHNPLALSCLSHPTSPPPLPATTTTITVGGGSSSSNSGNMMSRKITSMLHNEAIYDSNRMYEVIMNQRNEAALNFDQNSGNL